MISNKEGIVPDNPTIEQRQIEAAGFRSTGGLTG